jgi:hypothetical protein
MSFEDFLRQINVETWDGQPALVGMEPSPARREMEDFRACLSYAADRECGVLTAT